MATGIHEVEIPMDFACS